MPKPVSVHVPLGLSARLTLGHPWIYRNQIAAGALEAEGLPSGTWVKVHCGGFCAYGLYDADSPIAVRIFSRRSVPSLEWVADRVAEAWLIRQPIRSRSTTAYRWVYGESDGLPSIVVDLYGEYAVVRSYVRSVEGLVPWVADALHNKCPLKGILWHSMDGEVRPIWGRLPPHDLVVEENGLLFSADLVAGQKTGLYFDHRDNRSVLAKWCEGQSVLDCFCYTGAFGLYAARAGAKSVTACDGAAKAVLAARENYMLNGFDPEPHTFLTQDCFTLLEQYAVQGRRFDIIVLDPPSFAHEQKGRHRAERAYIRLNRLALLCVRPGGILASASCTSQVSPQRFQELLSEAAHQAHRRLVILHDAAHAVDHPVPVAFPEARYLKFVASRVQDPF